MPPNRTWSSNGERQPVPRSRPEAHPAQAKQPPPRSVPDVHATRRAGRADRARRGVILKRAAAHPTARMPPRSPGRASDRAPAGRARENLPASRRERPAADRATCGRPYRALLALALVGATLLALSWMGLALRNARRGAAQRRPSRRRRRHRALKTSGTWQRTRSNTTRRGLRRSLASSSRRPPPDGSGRRQPAAHRPRLAGASRTHGNARPAVNRLTTEAEARDEHRDDKHPRGHARASRRDDQVEGPDRCATCRADARVPGRRPASPRMTAGSSAGPPATPTETSTRRSGNSASVTATCSCFTSRRSPRPRAPNTAREAETGADRRRRRSGRGRTPVAGADRPDPARETLARRPLPGCRARVDR